MQKTVRIALEKGIHLYFEPVCSTDPDDENFRFWKGVPVADIVMYVTEPESANKFELGKEYLITFTLG